jgi:hypothetical protein
MKNLNRIYQATLMNINKINDFEQNQNLTICDEFKYFILNYQGSKVKEILFFDKQNNLYILNAFFSFAEMELLYMEFFDKYNRKLIPFAYDPGGWHFCLCMDEDDFGAIYINRWTDHLPNEQFLKIANSFEEFINGLKSEEEI